MTSLQSACLQTVRELLGDNYVALAEVLPCSRNAKKLIQGSSSDCKACAGYIRMLILLAPSIRELMEGLRFLSSSEYGLYTHKEKARFQCALLDALVSDVKFVGFDRTKHTVSCDSYPGYERLVVYARGYGYRKWHCFDWHNSGLEKSTILKCLDLVRQELQASRFFNTRTIGVRSLEDLCIIRLRKTLKERCWEYFLGNEQGLPVLLCNRIRLITPNFCTACGCDINTKIMCL